MAVNLQATPVTNTAAYRIALMNGGGIVATLDPGDAAVLTLVFDGMGSYNPGLPPVIRTQNPVAAIIVPPGNVGYIVSGAQFQFAAMGGGVAATVNFT